MIFGATVTIVRPGVKTTRAGSPVADWANATRTTLARVSMQPGQQTETRNTDRDVAISTWRLFTRPGYDADILATDHIEWAGMTFEVEGDVARWPDPRSNRVHHVEVELRRWAS